MIAHPEEHGPVKQILFADRGVLSVAPSSVNFCTRRGLDIWRLADEEGMKDLQCMAFMGRDPSASSGTAGVLTKLLVVGGCQDHLLKVDIARGEVVERVKATAHYTMMRRTATYILAATNTGQIHVMDPDTLRIVNTLASNNAFFSDMDARHNYLVTCGWVNRPQGTPMLSGLANVYDLRAMVQLPPISFHAGAAHVQMHPKMSTTCIIASQNGQMQEVDLMNPGAVIMRQANIQLAVQGLTMSSSGDALAIADASGSITLWGSPTRQNFVDVAHPTEFADAPAQLSNYDIDAPVPLSQLSPMPYYRDPLLSVWSNELVYEVGKAPAKIPAEVMVNLKSNNGVGMWASNPFEKRADWPRNVIRDLGRSEQDRASVVAPKFLSQKAKDKDPSQNVERRISDIQDLADNVAAGMGITKDEVPIMYRNVEIKYSKFGVDDFDFEYYNRTKYSGLETHIANSYVNPLLQLFRFTPFVRNLALRHAAANCLHDPCLLCEFGFLFDTLEKAEGANCQATNFLKAFSNIQDASRLNLLEEYSHVTTLAEMMQSANRFFLTQISNDFRRVITATRSFDQTFAIDAVTVMRCNHCHNEMPKPGTTWTTDLNYGPTPGARPRNQIPTFSQVLKQSIDHSLQTRGWCDRCKRYQNLQTRRNLRNMPDVLMFNAVAKSADAKRYWSHPGWLPDRIGVSIDGNKFVCFEKEDLRLHLEKKMYNIKVYDLVGVVADVHSAEQQRPHLVSIINVNIADKESTEEADWHLFNDFLVRKLAKEEALQFPTWKVPAVLAFQASGGRHAIDDSWKETLDTSLLFTDWSSNRLPPERSRPLDKNLEPPHAGDPIAIDTEFVALQQEEIEIKADGEREVIRPTRLGLARVSVLRGFGEEEGTPFINDYITVNEPIVDYLTKWSGVMEGDLDPRSSDHPLVPLKVAYKKLWLLVNLGCIFIGHGLPKDFRTINIHVPKSQVLDTVELFFIRARQRKLSLRFLAWYLLKEDIQQDNHDSIEDARTALRLWRKYEEFKDAGIVEQMLEEIYREGKKWQYKPPGEAQSLMKQRSEGLDGVGLAVDGSLTGRETPDILLGAVSGTGTPAAVRDRVRIRSAEFDSPNRL